MTFIDDYTRMCWVYLLKNKSDAFQTFKNFHKWIENDAQSHIGSIRTDNGKEYTSNEFEHYLRQHGIKHQTTVPYNPQQNGVAERMNRTILNMVRSMLFCKNVKIMLWADVVLCALYIKNRCPSNAIRNMTLLVSYNTSDYPITIVVIPLIYIVVPLLPTYCYFCAP